MMFCPIKPQLYNQFLACQLSESKPNFQKLSRGFCLPLKLLGPKFDLRESFSTDDVVPPTPLLYVITVAIIGNASLNYF